MNQIITISKIDDKGNEEYFFTKDHCQEHGLGDEWVSCTYSLPMKVEERDSLPSGIVNNKEDWKKVFGIPYINEFDVPMLCKEIPNPNPDYQA